MITVSQLHQATTKFFDRYIAKNLDLPTTWSAPKKTDGTSGLSPNGDRSGCYALLAGDEVKYVGVGRSWKKGRYQENALDARIRAHGLLVDKATNTYITRDKWRALGIDSLVTIGFPHELFFLASALEDYLINELKPEGNGLGKGR